MALFTKQPEKALTRDRDLAKANVDRLAAKISDAEVALIAANSLAQSRALSGEMVASMLRKPLSGPRCTGIPRSAPHMPKQASCWRFWNRRLPKRSTRKPAPRPASRPSRSPPS